MTTTQPGTGTQIGRKPSASTAGQIGTVAGVFP